MPDLDSRSKRASSMRLLLPFVLALPLADGAIAQADRQHTVCDYSGILAGASQVQAAAPDVIVCLGVDDYVVRMPGDDVVVLLPPDPLVQLPIDDVVVPAPGDDEDVIV